MRIALIYFPLRTLGPGERVGLWTFGCRQNCYGCISKELQDYNLKKPISIDEILNKINRISLKGVKRITISGGEPFENNDLLILLKKLKELNFEDILVYTGYTKQYIEEHFSETMKYIDVLIDGRYIDELNDNKPLRGSKNQNIYVFNPALKKIYDEYLQKPRGVDTYFSSDSLYVFGIPLKKL